MKRYFTFFICALLAAAMQTSCGDDITEIEVTPATGEFPDYGEALAFPGAVGHGRYATGGRGGKIYRVTTTDLTGEGSISEAVSEENRIIVFDVAGRIDLDKKTLVLKSNQTLLFQTAPAPGIELYNGRVSSSGASDLIVRYMRVRCGRQASGKDNLDAGGLASGKDVIYDHCSFTWGVDENFSINADNKGTRPQNITIQNCIIGQGCMNHSAGGLLQTNADEGVTIYRNLFIDNGTRNFKIKGLNQYVNNVIYNWGEGAYIMGGDSEGESDTQIENNYFIYGPCKVWRNTEIAKVPEEVKNNPEICSPATDSPSKFLEVLSQEKPSTPFTRGNEGFSTYCVGNYCDNNLDGQLNGEEITQANWGSYYNDPEKLPTFLPMPNKLHPALGDGLMTAADAYAWIVENVGATLPARDRVDAFMIEELQSLGVKGTIFRDQRKALQYHYDDGTGVFDAWMADFDTPVTATRPTDTDGDGMPDEWEEAHGLDKDDPDDAALLSENGYCNLENYLFELEAEIANK